MMKYFTIAAFGLLVAGTANAQDDGECSGGLCGTPEQSGGGCGCGCGCSILIAFTDQGDTYQYADDFDDDGIEDDFDNCAFGFNPDQADGDGDGRGDGCDNCPVNANFDLADVDADLVGDLCDPDADNDELPNLGDNCMLVPNPGQQNNDVDGFGNACDTNDDEDNCLDAVDACPLFASGNCTDVGTIQPNDCGRPDEDADGIDDALDNCFAEPNIDQGDTDGDGTGDPCDRDLDNDGIDNTIDNCLQVPNLAQGDADHDFRGDDCDPFQCFVITDEASCLDPAGIFDVHAGKTIVAETGKDRLLHIFANRDSRPIKYTWSVVEAPADGGNAWTITNPAGSVSVSQSVEYIYEPDREARFSTTVPGVYRLKLIAELVHPEDDAYPDSKTAQAEVEVTVAGDVINSFCAAAPGATAPAAMLLGLLALVRRRRR